MIIEPAGPAFSVCIEGASVRYGGDALIAGLDLVLPAASWTCLLGPSGIGKTSLLRFILGLDIGALGAGNVRCADGRPLAGRASYMAQRDLLLPWLSVRENVTLGARLRGGGVDRAAQARAESLIAAVGLQDAARLRPDALSVGMRQRAALARTLFENRPVVIMDEPFSALDLPTRLRLQALAARLLRGRTVLMVTHDPLEALRLASRVLVMSGRPAMLGAALTPPGSPPRAVDDPALLAHQGALLALLEAAVP
jgi:putative hydroxymethylpyrimidine transport system ATP-binding protein